MSEIQELFKIDIRTVIIGIIAILVAVKYIYELIIWLAGKLGIQFKSNVVKQEDHKLLENISQRVANIESENSNNIQRDNELVQVLNDVSDSINLISTKVDTLEKKLDNTTVASRESLADRINQKYKYYLRINGIPEDEINEFVELHKAYKGVGGNHSGDAKFKYCMEQLPILPAENKLDYGK